MQNGNLLLGTSSALQLMKIPLRALLLVPLLYVLLLIAFGITDHYFSFQGGANDMGNGLLVFAIGALVIAGFFIGSIYKAITVNKGYWAVVVTHLVLAGLFVGYFMI